MIMDDHRFADEFRNMRYALECISSGIDGLVYELRQAREMRDYMAMAHPKVLAEYHTYSAGTRRLKEHL